MMQYIFAILAVLSTILISVSGNEGLSSFSNQQTNTFQMTEERSRKKMYDDAEFKYNTGKTYLFEWQVSTYDGKIVTGDEVDEDGNLTKPAMALSLLKRNFRRTDSISTTGFSMDVARAELVNPMIMMGLASECRNYKGFGAFRYLTESLNLNNVHKFEFKLIEVKTDDEDT